MTSRRGFLSGFGAMLASLPLVGALFGKAEAHTGNVLAVGRFSGKFCQPPKPGQWFGKYEEGDGWTGRWVGPDAVLIRWIPVTERLPEIEYREVNRGLKPGSFSISKDVLIAITGGSVIPAYRRCERTLTAREEWVCNAPGDPLKLSGDGITHWAELPSPPINGNGKA